MMTTPKRGPGRPKGSKTKKPLEAAAEAAEIIPMPTRRGLPENPAELESAIASHRMIVSPIITGISGALEALGTTPLSSREHGEGVFAFSCLAYQYGAQIDARLICLAWALGVSVPRLSQWAKAKRTEGVQKLTPENLARAVAQPDMPQAAKAA